MASNPKLAALAARIRQSVSITETIERIAGITWARNSRRGDRWALCPFHAEKTPSFHVVEKRGEAYFKCHGCGKGGDVITFVSLFTGQSPGRVIRQLAEANGVADLDEDAQRRWRARQAEQRDELERRERREAEAKLEAARNLWEAAEPGHAAVRLYLAGRLGRYLDPLLEAIGGLPPSLRYHPSVGYRDQRTRKVVHKGPCMLARLGRGRFIGVHRTWIDGGQRQRDPGGEKLAKMMLGGKDRWGAPCVLADPDLEILDPGGVIVGEGIESSLAGAAILISGGFGAGWGVEAAISGGALWGPGIAMPRRVLSKSTGKELPSAYPDLDTDRPGWLPPAGVGRVRILGEASAKCPESAARCAERARRKLEAHGLYVELRLPTGGWSGGADFADEALRP